MTVLMLTAFLCGCAGSTVCSAGGSSVLVSPTAGTADHAAASPGNQQKFTAAETPPAAQPGCPVPQVIEVLQPVWTSSDPLDVTISSAQDVTNGLATCVNATGATVVLTAKGMVGGTAYSQVATLTCK